VLGEHRFEAQRAGHVEGYDLVTASGEVLDDTGPDEALPPVTSMRAIRNLERFLCA
jgi:hypothetical protein